MEVAGVMENTFVFIMGDHGQRIVSDFRILIRMETPNELYRIPFQSPIQKTHVGRIEERMSMMGIHVPQKFRNEHPEKFENLVVNKNRLTSNFDIHETLEDIFDLTLGTRHGHLKGHGISLFKEIPKDRTCAEALIPENFCCCMEIVEDSRIDEAEVSYASR